MVSLGQEAVHCREQAAHFKDRPEEVLLLHLAREFERLANINRRQRTSAITEVVPAPWS
jgi:hypothetical protein